MLVTVFCLLNVAVLALAGDESKQCPYADKDEEWSYTGENGPADWGKNYPTCGNGKEQSPIDIDTQKATENPIQLEGKNYNTIHKAICENKGYTIEVTPLRIEGVNDDDWMIIVDGEKYRLEQCHFHWGCEQGQGSEHTIDEKQYEMEAHCVHKNDNGDLAVVAILFEEKNDTVPPPELQKIVNVLPRFKGGKTVVKDLDPSGLLAFPFYGYNGSLTTPNCAEGVKWFVAMEPSVVTHSQMRRFRELYTFPDRYNWFGWTHWLLDWIHSLFYSVPNDGSCNLCDNFREPQALNNRTVLQKLEFNQA